MTQAKQKVTFMKWLPVKYSKRRIFIFVILCLLWLNFFLLDRGFCYREMTFMSKRQMMERFVFGEDADIMTLEEKAAKLERLGRKEHPNHCSIRDQPSSGFSFFTQFIYSLGGKKLFAVECVSVRDQTKSENLPYYITNTAIKSCGLPTHDSSGMGISEDLYKAIIRNNAKKWKDQRK